MRVIAGTAKGRRLKSPPIRTRTRPTSDLMRGSIFDVLAAMGADLARVLDLYAGSGALGIEALSRGADHCDFVEKDAAACAVIHQNLALTGFREQAEVLCMPVERALDRLPGRYTLVLADPPYADGAAVGTLETLASSSLPAEQCLIVLEHSSREEPAARLGPLSLLNARRHGDSAVSIYGRR